jgi:5-deoxy-glucuronate isomerase
VRRCGRIRKEIGTGWTPITDGELANLEMAVLRLEGGESHALHTQDREYAIVLIQGNCHVALRSGMKASMGPRRNPFEDVAYALFVSRNEEVGFKAQTDSLFGIASALATKKLAPTFITPNQVDVSMRGAGNWTREVRKVCWSDNTEGNLLLAGETCTPSGNWSTIPPHRHQYDVEGEEAPYEEIYFFQFSHPKGYGLVWQFDDEGDLDQAFSLKAGDAVYHNNGYHPTVCGPGTTLYHLTFMAGIRRESRARVHQDYRYILDEANLENQFTPR